MEIKVKNIKTQNGRIDPLETPLIEAKLVLVPDKNGEYISTLQANLPDNIGYRGFCKPILISEEEMEINDPSYHSPTGTIDKFVKGDMHCAKILALPEHFSKEQLNMIVGGKLKDGDKLLVECVYKGDYDVYLGHGDKDARIKSPLSIYPIEEKLYNRGQVEKIMADFMEDMFNKNWSYNNYQQLRYKITNWLNENNK